MIKRIVVLIIILYTSQAQAQGWFGYGTQPNIGTNVHGDMLAHSLLWTQAAHIFNVNLLPQTDTSLDIGSPSFKWNNAYYAGQVQISIASGMPPLVIASTDRNVNLNADLLDGEHAVAFADASHAHDHGVDLTGLGDDDHTQYLLADGTRALGGNWDLGGFNLTNGGVITGSDFTLTPTGGVLRFDETTDVTLTGSDDELTMAGKLSITGGGFGLDVGDTNVLALQSGMTNLGREFSAGGRCLDVSSIFSGTVTGSGSSIGGFSLISGNNISGTIRGLFFGGYATAASNLTGTIIGIETFGFSGLFGNVTQSAIIGARFSAFDGAQGFGGSYTFTDGYALYVKDSVTTGTLSIGTLYGIFVDEPTKGATNYQAVLAGSGMGTGLWFGGTSGERLYSDGANLVSAATLKTESGRIKNTTRVTSTPYTILATDHVIFVNTDAVARTADLPAGTSAIEGTQYVLINSGSSSNNLTVSPNATDHLFGVNEDFILFDGESLILTYNDTDGWY